MKTDDKEIIIITDPLSFLRTEGFTHEGLKFWYNTGWGKIIERVYS